MLALGGCASVGTAETQPSESHPGITLPPIGAAPDYQLGGAYEPDAAVGIVVRDRTADAASDRYSICYINGFQTQPGELGLWPDDLLLHDDDGAPLIDAGWPDEVLLDTSTPGNRAAISAIIAPWVRGCGEAGYSAVEFDNLDSFTRSRGTLTAHDNGALAADLAALAHSAGLAAGQKNAAEFAADLHGAAGFDFAVAEECSVYDECRAYSDVYGDHVIAIEYPDALDSSFAEVCTDPATPASVVLRDRDLVSPDDPDYVFELC